MLFIDSRFVGCVPSVLATATMLHVIDQIEQSDDNGVDYRNQLLNVLKISKVSSSSSRWIYVHVLCFCLINNLFVFNLI